MATYSSCDLGWLGNGCGLWAGEPGRRLLDSLEIFKGESQDEAEAGGLSSQTNIGTVLLHCIYDMRAPGEWYLIGTYCVCTVDTYLLIDSFGGATCNYVQVKHCGSGLCFHFGLTCSKTRYLDFRADTRVGKEPVSWCRHRSGSMIYWCSRKGYRILAVATGFGWGLLTSKYVRYCMYVQ
jgi:hypothetical protein